MTESFHLDYRTVDLTRLMKRGRSLEVLARRDALGSPQLLSFTVEPCRKNSPHERPAIPHTHVKTLTILYSYFQSDLSQMITFFLFFCAEKPYIQNFNSQANVPSQNLQKTRASSRLRPGKISGANSSDDRTSLTITYWQSLAADFSRGRQTRYPEEIPNMVSPPPPPHRGKNAPSVLLVFLFRLCDTGGAPLRYEPCVITQSGFTTCSLLGPPALCRQLCESRSPSI